MHILSSIVNEKASIFSNEKLLAFLQVLVECNGDWLPLCCSELLRDDFVLEDGYRGLGGILGWSWCEFSSVKLHPIAFS